VKKLLASSQSCDNQHTTKKKPDCQCGLKKAPIGIIKRRRSEKNTKTRKRENGKTRHPTLESEKVKAKPSLLAFLPIFCKCFSGGVQISFYEGGV